MLWCRASKKEEVLSVLSFSLPAMLSHWMALERKGAVYIGRPAFGANSVLQTSCLASGHHF